MSGWLPGLAPDVLAEGRDGAADCWFTPRPIVDAVSDVLPGWGDPCADARSPCRPLAAWCIDVREGGDGLVHVWGRRAWVNPPYSNASEWIARCSAMAGEGRQVVALLPFRAEGNAWHRHVWGRADVVLPRGRIKFVALDGETYGAAQIGTAFVCWGVDAQALAASLRRRAGLECVVLGVQPAPAR